MFFGKLNPFKRRYNVDYGALISQLEDGNLEDIPKLLWQPQNGIVQYLPISTDMILKLKKETGSALGLSIYEQHQRDRFELVIFKIPWGVREVPFEPIIIDRANGKIVGIMLPFNELHFHLNHREQKQIGELGIIWTKFVLKQRGWI